MNRERITSRRIAVILVMLLTLSALCTPICAEPAPDEEVTEIFSIRTAQDLLDLADLCRSDVWSEDITVVLENDISLAGISFEPIRYFAGTFDGGGHTIRDAAVTSSVSPCGIFAEVAQKAKILNLNVAGDFTPGGNADSVGGIAGINNGLIAGCSFSGSISGNAFVGGIVGENCSFGCIQSCRSDCGIIGSSMTGGIAGRNAGTIQGCRNKSFVNIVSSDPKLNLNDLDIAGILKSFTVASSDVIGVIQDTGGIAGYNSGIIGECRNSAPVGYQHIGYNVGGIAGRSCGHIYSCQNSGEIYGRKDIGGIVGQMEPYIDLLSEYDMIGNLAGQYSGLTYCLNEATEDAEAISNAAANKYRAMSGRVSSLVDVLLATDITNPDSIKNSASAISGSLTSFSGSLNGLGNDLSQASGVLSDDMKDINNQIGGIAGATTGLIRAITDPSNLQIIFDTSADDIDSVTYGKIEQCENTANVYGDLNIGGVIGQMSVESVMNPEDDLEVSLGGTVRTEYEYKAVLLECRSSGSIAARKNCAGSICGLTNLGIIVRCGGYGTVTSENGNYVGGISGLNRAKITSCWAKCTLSGGSYVGGICGNGFDDGDNSSSVSDCTALVHIQDCSQFSGAVSGYSAGVYSGNRFVSDELQGINGLSIAGIAEPVSYEELLAQEDVPDIFRTFSLSFQIEDTIAKTVSVHYGDPLDPRTFPPIPEKEGYLAFWENEIPESLHTDYTLHAVYVLYDTILPANLVRANGRPALYAEGRFAEGAQFKVVQTPTEHIVTENDCVPPVPRQVATQLVKLFRGEGFDTVVRRGILEQLTLEIPEDGQAVHTIRYTVPSQSAGTNCSVFLHNNDGLIPVEEKTIGRYICFPVTGNTAEIVVFSTAPTVWMLLILAAAGVLVCALLVLLIRIIRKHPSRKLIAKAHVRIQNNRAKYTKGQRMTIFLSILVTIVFLVSAGLLLRSSPLGYQLRAVNEVRSLLAKEDSAFDLKVTGNWGHRQLDDTYTLSVKQAHGVRVTCMGFEDATLFYCKDRIYLSNGAAYVLDDTLVNRAELPEAIAALFRKGRVQKQDTAEGTCYRIPVQAEDAKNAFRLLVPEVRDSDEISVSDNMTLELLEKDQRFCQLTCHCAGKTEKEDVSLTITVTPAAVCPDIPEAVVDAIYTNAEPSGILTSELLDLAEAWIRFDTTPMQTGTVYLSADCGSFKMNDRLQYCRRITENTPISFLKKNGMGVYVSQNGACTESGEKITAGEELLADLPDMLEYARVFSQNTQLSMDTINGNQIYTLTLDPEIAQKFREKIAPLAILTEPDSLSGTLTLTVSGGQITDIHVDCIGETKIVRSTVEAGFHGELKFDPLPQDAPVIPAAVKNILIVPQA